MGTCFEAPGMSARSLSFIKRAVNNWNKLGAAIKYHLSLVLQKWVHHPMPNTEKWLSLFLIFFGEKFRKMRFFFPLKKNQNKIAALDFLEQIFKRPFDFNF